MSDAIEQLREKYKAICHRLVSPCQFHTMPQHDGSAHVEYLAGIYSYVITERGSEFERRNTESQDQILYWLTSDTVFDLACKFELHNRVAGQDSRRLMFAKKIELMSLVDPAWGERKANEHQGILSKHPFVDRVEG